MSAYTHANPCTLIYTQPKTYMYVFMYVRQYVFLQYVEHEIMIKLYSIERKENKKKIYKYAYNAIIQCKEWLMCIF